MTAAALALPLSVGSMLGTAAGRTARWAFARFMRAPLANSGVAVLAGLSALTMSNALYFQAHRHPAPLFGVEAAQATQVAPIPAPIDTRPKAKPAPARISVLPATPAPPAAAPAAGQPIGNAEVFELQRKLQALGLFDGSIDGWYGPRTARAIKAFEERNGMKPLGELTPDVLAAILAASIITPTQPQTVLRAPEPVPDPVPAPQATPAAVTDVPNALPAQVVEEPRQAATGPVPLPMPAPLSSNLTTASAATPVSTRALPETPEEVLEIAAGVASDAADAIGALVESVTGPDAIATQPMPPLASALPSRVAVATPAQWPRAAPVSATPLVQAPTVATAPTTPVQVNDPRLVAKVQRGLASLGFLRGEIDGVPGETTARAIRNFEVWNNYDVTGRVTPQLVDLLVAAGAVI